MIEGTGLLRCGEGKSNNHNAKNCRNEETCLKCHGNFKTKECTNQQIEKCINCTYKNQQEIKYGFGTILIINVARLIRKN